jgi:hypothetical protein
MKDQLISLIEAVRLCRLELECHRDPHCRSSDEWIVNRLSELLESEDVSRAMQALVPGEQSPSIIPESPMERMRDPCRAR